MNNSKRFYLCINVRNSIFYFGVTCQLIAVDSPFSPANTNFICSNFVQCGFGGKLSLLVTTLLTRHAPDLLAFSSLYIINVLSPLQKIWMSSGFITIRLSGSRARDIHLNAHIHTTGRHLTSCFRSNLGNSLYTLLGARLSLKFNLVQLLKGDEWRAPSENCTPCKLHNGCPLFMHWLRIRTGDIFMIWNSNLLADFFFKVLWNGI